MNGSSRKDLIMLTNVKKHNAATFLENDEDIKRAELIAHLQEADDLLEQRVQLILCFILISVLWIWLAIP